MISVVIPAHNEEKAVGTVLDELIDALEGQEYEIIVVDDGSTDNTAKIVQQKESVKLIQHPINKGYGAALKTGIRNAKADIVLFMDADGQHKPDDIKKSYNTLEDMIWSLEQERKNRKSRF
jgi:glycosyltransferase involved in cell wall biosynthesis